MPAQIRPTRLDVTDRFPMVGFRIRTDGGPSQAEVAIAVDPALFAPDRKKDRTAANFYSTRGNGGVRFQGSEAGYTVPPEVLARFIGNEKLYFGLATAGDGGAMKVAVMPNETSPYISIKGLSGRSMSRVRVLPNRQQRAAGYKRNVQEQLEWAGDVPVPGMEPVANGAAPAAASPNGAAAPAHYDDGFGPLPDSKAPAVTPVPSPGGPAAQSLAAQGVGYPPVRALSDEPVSLTPPEVGTLGWVARKAAEVAIGMAPGGVGALFNAVIELANSQGCSVGVGPQVGAGLGAGGALGYGVIFGKDGDLGVYGSAEIDIGFITSISATACVTIVQGGIDAFNGWNAGFAISGGEGVVGGAMILLNDKSEFVGASANIGVGVGFSPIDFYVAAQRGWSTRVQSLALAYAQGMSAPVRARARAPVQARRYSNGSGVGYARTQGGGARALDAGSTTLDIRYRCFIPSPLIDSPFTVYGGDGRGFSENGGTSRGDLHARVTLASTAAIEGISIIDRHWGESSEYRTEDSYHVEGKPDWWLGKVDGAQPTKWDTLQADDDNLNITVGSTGSARNVQAAMESASIFSITASGSLPLSMVAPAIDADIAILVRPTASGGIECKVVGEHDGFPCHELYVNSVCVYKYDPVAAGKGPTALSPPMDIDANSDWIDCTGSGATAQSLGVSSWTVNWDDVELVPQPTEFSCWAAAGAMLVGWRDRVSLTPDSVAASCRRSTASGLLTDDNATFASEMGFIAVPPVCYTEDGFRALLESSGPLWVSEGIPPNLHAIIVTGMYSDGTNTYVRIADPWDRMVGTPGAPGNYATTHDTGSRYIMSWADFTQQYEAAMTGEPLNRQILHSGNPNGLSPNTGQTAPPPGYAQSLGRAHARKMDVGRALSNESFTINWDEVQQIAQPTDVSCWATSASMVLGWRDQQSIDINYIAQKAGLTTATGLDPAQVGQFASDMGLVAEPPQSYTIDGFRQLVANNGPLWVGAAVPGLHAIVVTGVYSDGTSTFVRITDPWDREIGLPGSPGNYADTHAAGSRYIMRWEDFVAEYEKAATDFSAVNLQILHCGGTFGRVPNTGGSTPVGYAQGLAANKNATPRKPLPEFARARSLGEEPASPSRTVGGQPVQTASSVQGNVSCTLDHFQGPKHPGNMPPANGGGFSDAETIRLEWPMLDGAGGATGAAIAIDWLYDGRSIGDVRIANTRSWNGDAALQVKGEIIDDDVLYQPGDCAALQVRLTYRFTPKDAPEVTAITDVHLYGDGTHEVKSHWVAANTQTTATQPMALSEGDAIGTVAGVVGTLIALVGGSAVSKPSWLQTKHPGDTAPPGKRDWRKVKVVTDNTPTSWGPVDRMGADFTVEWECDGLSLRNIFFYRDVNTAILSDVEVVVDVIPREATHAIYYDMSSPMVATVELQFTYTFIHKTEADEVAIHRMRIFGDGTSWQADEPEWVYGPNIMGIRMHGG
jgi:Papain-like cysteine protease AvrRpt2/Protein of unknown function (DUF3238)